MPGDYTINWTTGALKSPFTLTSGTVDSTTTSLILTGRGASNWGEPLQENLLHILENFAGPIAPEHPTIGQLWYDSGEQKYKGFNGSTWSLNSVGGAPASTSVAGIAAFATQPEADAGVITDKTISPAVLKASITAAGIGGSAPAASTSVAGIAMIATQPEADTGTNNTKFITPLVLKTSITAAIGGLGGGGGIPFLTDIQNLNGNDVSGVYDLNFTSGLSCLAWHITDPSKNFLTFRIDRTVAGGFGGGNNQIWVRYGNDTTTQPASFLLTAGDIPNYDSVANANIDAFTLRNDKGGLVSRISAYADAIPTTSKPDVIALAEKSLYVDAAVNLYYRDMNGFSDNGNTIINAKSTLPETDVAANHTNLIPFKSLYYAANDNKILYKKADGNTVEVSSSSGGTAYAPIASPAFTGTPTAPTPANASNDTSLATTAFVKTTASGFAQLDVKQQWTKPQYGAFIDGVDTATNLSDVNFELGNNFRVYLYATGTSGKTIRFDGGSPGQSGVIEVINFFPADIDVTLSLVSNASVFKTFTDQYMVSNNKTSVLTYVLLSGGNPVFSLIKDIKNAA